MRSPFGVVWELIRWICLVAALALGGRKGLDKVGYATSGCLSLYLLLFREQERYSPRRWFGPGLTNYANCRPIPFGGDHCVLPIAPHLTIQAPWMSMGASLTEVRGAPYVPRRDAYINTSKVQCREL